MRKLAEVEKVLGIIESGKCWGGCGKSKPESTARDMGYEPLLQ